MSLLKVEKFMLKSVTERNSNKPEGKGMRVLQQEDPNSLQNRHGRCLYDFRESRHFSTGC